MVIRVLPDGDPPGPDYPPQWVVDLIADAARAEELFSVDELEEHARKTRESGGG